MLKPLREIPPMKNKSDVNKICLQVMSKITASISHDLKNTISIINENAGLLDDLAQLTEADSGVPQEYIHQATTSIIKQVERSNTIIKNINKFAHSADDPLVHANLEESLSLVVSLTSRQAVMKHLNVVVSCSPEVAIYTYILPFQSLVYLILCRIYMRIDEHSSLSIVASVEKSMITLNFVVNQETCFSLVNSPNENEQVLTEQLHASYLNNNQLIKLTLPVHILEL